MKIQIHESKILEISDKPWVIGIAEFQGKDEGHYIVEWSNCDFQLHEVRLTANPCWWNETDRVAYDKEHGKRDWSIFP